MTTTAAEQTTAVARSWRRLGRHFLEMLLAMAIGMMAMYPLWRIGLDAVDAGQTLENDTLAALIMATDMSLGMAAWMRYRGHRWRSIVEMSSTMYLPFVIFFPVVWAGAMPGSLMLVLGHNLMLPAMLAVMLWRRDEYDACTIQQASP